MSQHNLQRSAASIHLPAPELSEIFLDFDGTLTRQDALDELVARFAADDSWIEVERKWAAGAMGSRECLGREFDLLRITPDELDRFLAAIDLDPGAGRLFSLLSALQLPTTVLSDGVDLFIERLLERLGPGVLPENLVVRANTVHRRGDRLELVCPHISPACETAAAHCKCRSMVLMHTPGRLAVYVGDGLSDLCPARRAEAIFAKGRLAESLTREEIPFMPFNTLDDVVSILSDSWSRWLAPLSAR